METTEWYPGNIEPKYVGVYERKYPTGIYLAYWTGEHWGMCAAVMKYAQAWRDQATNSPDLPWRGVKAP